MDTQTKYIVYSAKEKILLATLVKDNAIIENKRTDGATLMEKHKAWEEICRTYNFQPEVDTMRTPEQLKKLWNNLKQRRSIAVVSVSKENGARVQKLHQATEQQELLYNLQQQILEELQRAVEERVAAKKKAELEFPKTAKILDQKLKKKIEERAALKKN
ncbi:hypothetical protein FQA39_LY04081 [Lamprigera yunnana]|nr:hypothetical protein FQA39_LY04081 [Lamprigera yunnana]